MPASMMSEASGVRPKVIGNSMAIVATGPMPGSTPMSVPTRQPMSAKPILLNEAAAPKPIAKLWKRLNSILPTPPGGHRLSQHVDKQDHAENGEPCGKQDCFGYLHAPAPRISREDRHEHRGQCQTDS